MATRETTGRLYRRPQATEVQAGLGPHSADLATQSRVCAIRLLDTRRFTIRHPETLLALPR